MSPKYLILIIILFYWICVGTLSACTSLSENELEQNPIAMNEKETEEAVRLCYLKMYQAMMGKDSIGLAEVLDDSFVLVHMTGMRQLKKEFIQAVLDGTLNYYTAEHDEISLLKLDGGQASMVGRTRVEAVVFGGGRRTWSLQQDIDLTIKDGKWFITEARASTY